MRSLHQDSLSTSRQPCTAGLAEHQSRFCYANCTQGAVQTCADMVFDVFSETAELRDLFSMRRAFNGELNELMSGKCGKTVFQRVQACTTGQCSGPCERWQYEASITTYRAMDDDSGGGKWTYSRFYGSLLVVTQMAYLNYAPLEILKIFKRSVSPPEDTLVLLMSLETPFSQMEIYDRETYTWNTLVSNIGGQLGLWLGASALSLVQLLYASLAACYRRSVYGENFSK